MRSPTHLDPGWIIADCQEDNFVLLIIVSSPVNIQSRVIEAVVHNAAPGGPQLGIVISLAAVDPHKYHTPGLRCLDALLEALHQSQQVVMEGEVSSQLRQYVFEQPQKMWIQS